ncbi:MAG: hypoxanthine phosphoribosyltransferase [Planctomycetes bacterium]|nr:hypoxanthine phosphoribosyltransferase [Planctomycetota bacterium]
MKSGTSVPHLAAASAPPHRLQQLLSEAEIQKRVSELAQQLTKDYAGSDPVIVCILKGSFVFAGDLIRQLDFPLSIEFMRVSSYGKAIVTSGEVKLELDLANSVANRQVLLLEDVIDTGLTVDYLKANLRARSPSQVRVCTLLHKPANRIKAVPIDYAGFEIHNKFVVGYGLDYHGYYRNLPYIATLEEIVAKS